MMGSTLTTIMVTSVILTTSNNFLHKSIFNVIYLKILDGHNLQKEETVPLYSHGNPYMRAGYAINRI